jgi:hypothetical protein
MAAFRNKPISLRPENTAARPQNVQTCQTQYKVNRGLAAGRLDYVLANGTTLDTFLKYAQGGTFEAKGAVPLDLEIVGEGAGDTALAEKLNAALASSGRLDDSSARNGLTGLFAMP